MKSHSLLLFAALVLPSMAISQETTISWEPTPPGLIETFLSKTQNASINKKLLGVLGGSANPKATFTAIVAEDPSRPGVKLKGIEIEMEATARKVKVYVDDDHSADSRDESLREFAFSLNELAQAPSDRIFESTKGVRATKPGKMVVTTGAQNRAANNEEYCCPRYAAFNAGYLRGDELGVRIDDAGKTRNGILYFPNEKLTRVADFIVAGKAWLDLN